MTRILGQAYVALKSTALPRVRLTATRGHGGTLSPSRVSLTTYEELPLLAAWREMADRESLGGMLEGYLFAVAFDYCHSDDGERSQNECPSRSTFRYVYLTGGLMRARLRLEDVKIIVLSGYHVIVFGECQDATPLKP
jgi:hypothetical protein